MSASGIYQIRNTVNGKVYVGSAVNLARRWCAHRNDLGKSIMHHCEPLCRAWNKYGAGAFIFEILEEIPHKETLIMREQHHMDTARAAGVILYNKSPRAGNFFGVKHTKETCAKHAGKNRGNAHAVGYKHSKEDRIKISISLLGNTRTLGLKHSKEARAKIAAALVGRECSEQTRAKLKTTWLMKTQTPGYKHNCLGRKFSQESIAKMSASRKAYYARRTHERSRPDTY